MSTKGLWPQKLYESLFSFLACAVLCDPVCHFRPLCRLTTEVLLLQSSGQGLIICKLGLNKLETKFQDTVLNFKFLQLSSEDLLTL